MSKGDDKEKDEEYSICTSNKSDGTLQLDGKADSISDDRLEGDSGGRSDGGDRGGYECED